MLHGPQRDSFDLSFEVPSRCADRLADGSADIGIVPVVEVVRQGLEVIPGACIACRGPVRSILLVSKVPPASVRTLAGDISSRTSVMLARVLLAHRYGSEPRLISMPPDLDVMLSQTDAALIIGDPALHIDPSRLPYHVLDLGREWVELTGLPMVFAVWAGPAGKATPDLEPVFSGSCLFGLQNLDTIVSEEATRRGLPEALARRYLTHHIAFELGPREREGMSRFLGYAQELDSQPLAVQLTHR